MHIEQLYKWAQTLEKPPLEFLPKFLENLVHSYVKPAIAYGMQHLAYKDGLSFLTPGTQYKKKNLDVKTKTIQKNVKRAKIAN